MQGCFETANILWPPKGWNQFSVIKSCAGQAIGKDIGKARIYGLHYSIESSPVLKDNRKIFNHHIVLTGWEYSILNESIEYPVLSFSLMDRFAPDLPIEHFLSDIRTYDSLIPTTKRSGARALRAALFLMKQVADGMVPDVNRVLRTYKLHPTQAFLYRGDSSQMVNLGHAFERGQRPIKTSQN